MMLYRFTSRASSPAILRSGDDLENSYVACVAQTLKTFLLFDMAGVVCRCCDHHIKMTAVVHDADTRLIS